MLAYPYILTPDDNGTLLVTFPDIPEAVAVGEDEDTAKIEAIDGLICALGKLSLCLQKMMVSMLSFYRH